MQIQAPDIGVDKALVAEILVKIGDRVAVEDSLLVLESDKATVEVPSTAAGIVKSILVKQGDEVTEGVALVELEAESQATESRVVETAQVETPKVETQSEQIESAFSGEIACYLGRMDSSEKRFTSKGPFSKGAS